MSSDCTAPQLNQPVRLSILLTACLAALLLLGAGLRLYDLTDQPIDFHPTRQLRGAIIARGMFYQMSPELDPNRNEQAVAFWASTGQYEPPILERAAALSYLLLGQEVPWLARLYNSLFWTAVGLALFDLARRMRIKSSDLYGEPRGNATVLTGAFAALVFYLVLPFGVQASRSFQPDPGMAAWLVLSAWAAFRWSEQPGWKWAILAGIFSGLAILTKAVAAYTVGSLLTGLVLFTFRDPWRRTVIRAVGAALRSSQVWCMLLLALVPAVMYYFGRGERTSEFLTSWTLELSRLLLQPATYLHWVNLVQELITPAALLLSLVGVLLAEGRTRVMLAGLWLGYTCYGLFLPYQMTTHSYYHLQLVPVAALSLVPAAQRLAKWLLTQRAAWRYLAGGLAVCILIFGAWQALIPMIARDYRNEPAYWQEIAAYLPEDGKIIALTQDYGYRLMYYGWRKVVVWPNRGEIKLSILRGSQKEFQDFFIKRIDGKSYFLITAFNQYADQPVLQEILQNNFPIFAQGNGYLIFDLMNPNSSEPAQTSETPTT
jgi:4-amino-4-deoxy-L-arabinose transferase-like glycosyltransferase